MAYSRRKTWENQALATTLAGLLRMPSASRGPEMRAGHRWLEADALLAAMGAKLN